VFLVLDRIGRSADPHSALAFGILLPDRPLASEARGAARRCSLRSNQKVRAGLGVEGPNGSFCGSERLQVLRNDLLNLSNRAA
jgi:hypothetical protein